MYSNKYPGSGPVPPPLDNNLAINTAQGRVRPGARARPREAPPHLHLQHPGRSQGTPTFPWFQPQAGQAGSDHLCLDPASQRQESTRAGHTGQPLSCCPKMPGEGFLHPLPFG